MPCAAGRSGDVLVWGAFCGKPYCIKSAEAGTARTFFGLQPPLRATHLRHCMRPSSLTSLIFSRNSPRTHPPGHASSLLSKARVVAASHQTNSPALFAPTAVCPYNPYGSDIHSYGLQGHTSHRGEAFACRDYPVSDENRPTLHKLPGVDLTI